ncbi:glycosyltransferase family 2 protein [Yersinia pseudotuberculosis]|uniref:Putative abequose transferase n=1 Tax=Yersinia pseudotuberculosis TaxID=633 RepID=D7P8M0_YERPU|nr:glycosyltransferase family 2 protein [Yersinia pseudotuberculosis]ADI59444.1 putative abequose transferase [Yersinia pseudotuberculosis]AXY32140.1 glycosyltransferase family 2 protein [Yersinia pseudotuberculosis]AYX11813.1 glycosyltransferase family 2 protein [Yersinia pseudotuberculosis]MBO1564322.1 glycosyltransferase [Yersinia pseudotuberculosis]MBO1588207.1 glycosyltransferase [Yersinia pseudotuberculosis]
MSNIKISFCIPTYNRSELLSELIESIVSQCENRNDIEICISDNASSDNTSEMIAKWKESTDTPIVYKVNKENIGPDRNYLAAVDLASGEYCWLFGSDDKLVPHSIINIDKYLNANTDIYIVDRFKCDLSMKILSQQAWMTTGDKEYDTSNLSELDEFLDNSLFLGAIFSYLSSIIVKREGWNSVSFEAKHIGTAYVHVYYLLTMMRNGVRIKYINKPLVLCRGGNDFFSINGFSKRILLDFDGYESITQDVFRHNHSIKKKILSILLKERPVIHTIIAVAVYGDYIDKVSLRDHYKKLGVNELFFDFIYFFRPVYKLADKLNLSSKYKWFRVFFHDFCIPKNISK